MNNAYTTTTIRCDTFIDDFKTPSPFFPSDEMRPSGAPWTPLRTTTDQTDALTEQSYIAGGFAELEAIIDYKFTNRNLLIEASTVYALAGLTIIYAGPLTLDDCAHTLY